MTKKRKIEESEYKRLKSREEKYLAYMDMLSYWWEDETYVDALCWKVAQLQKENERLKIENISLHIELEEIQDNGYLSYEEKLYMNN